MGHRNPMAMLVITKGYLWTMVDPGLDIPQQQQRQPQQQQQHLHLENPKKNIFVVKKTSTTNR